MKWVTNISSPYTEYESETLKLMAVHAPDSERGLDVWPRLPPSPPPSPSPCVLFWFFSRPGGIPLNEAALMMVLLFDSFCEVRLVVAEREVERFYDTIDKSAPPQLRLLKTIPETGAPQEKLSFLGYDFIRYRNVYRVSTGTLFYLSQLPWMESDGIEAYSCSGKMLWAARYYFCGSPRVRTDYSDFTIIIERQDMVEYTEDFFRKAGEIIAMPPQVPEVISAFKGLENRHTHYVFYDGVLLAGNACFWHTDEDIVCVMFIDEVRNPWLEKDNILHCVRLLDKHIKSGARGVYVGDMPSGQDVARK